MDPFELREIVSQQPFRPFRLRIALNILVEVKHPELVFVNLSTAKIFPEPGQDEIVVILSQIITVEYLPRRIA